MRLLRPRLTEFQRRLWPVAEAAELVSGGVAIMAAARGVTADTVRRGRAFEPLTDQSIRALTRALTALGHQDLMKGQYFERSM